MRKLILFLALLGLSISSQSQVWTQTGNSLQRQTNGTYSNYRFNLGSPGFMYFYNKTQTDSLFNIAVGSGVTSFNTRIGAVSLLSGDVTTALGFTPENVANKTNTVSNSPTLYPSVKAVQDYTYSQAASDAKYGILANTQTWAGGFNNFTNQATFGAGSADTWNIIKLNAAARLKVAYDYPSGFGAYDKTLVYLASVAPVGNNSIAQGIEGIVIRLSDPTGLTANQGNNLFGMQIRLNPLVARTIPGNDDATPIIINNVSDNLTAGADAVYVGNAAGSGGAWGTTRMWNGAVFKSEANAFQLLGASGSYSNGIDFYNAGSSSVFSNTAMYMPNNMSIMKFRNQANTAALPLIATTTNNNIVLGAQTYLQATTGYMGIGTTTPTADLTLGTAKNYHQWNTADMTTNTEYFSGSWIGNTYTMKTVNAGTGVLRPISLISGGTMTLTAPTGITFSTPTISATAGVFSSNITAAAGTSSSHVVIKSQLDQKVDKTGFVADATNQNNPIIGTNVDNSIRGAILSGATNYPFGFGQLFTFNGNGGPERSMTLYYPRTDFGTGLYVIRHNSDGTFNSINELANKTYVNAADALKLNLTGGTLTGALNGTTLALSGNVTAAAATTASQVVIKSQLDLKENLSNKQNSLTADGSGVKYPTVDAVNLSLLNKDSIGFVFVNIASTGLVKYFRPTANTDAARGVALQGAFLFASKNDGIFIGAGKYKTTTTILLKDSLTITGNGVIYNTSTDIFSVKSVANVLIKDITIIGGGGAVSLDTTLQTGIRVSGYSPNFRAVNLTINNCPGSAIYEKQVWKDSTQFFNGGKIINCNTRGNGYGFYGIGEYWTIDGGNHTYNLQAFYAVGGNIKIINTNTSYNQRALVVIGTVGNEGHAVISGNTFTHNKKVDIFLKNLTIGEVLTANIFAGAYPATLADTTIYLENTSGVRFSHSQFLAPMHIYLGGTFTGYNYIEDSHFYNNAGGGGNPANVVGTTLQKSHLIFTGNSSNDSLSTTLNREYGNNKTVLQFLGATTGYQIGQFLGTRGNFIFGINGSSPIGSPTDAPYSSFINTGNKSNLNFGTNQLQTAYIDSLTQTWHFVKDVYLDNALATGVSSDVILTKDASTNKLKSIPYNTFQTAITFGTGVQSALGINIGSAGAPVLFNGVGGTPSSIVLTNATGTASALNIGGNAATSTNITAFPLNQSVASTSTPTFSGFTFATSGVQTGRFIDGGTFLSLDTYNGTDFSSRALRLIGNTVTIGSGSSGTAALTISATQNATFSGNLSATTFNSTATQTTVAGSTSGSIVASMPFQGSSYKKVMIYCNGIVGTATYTFPVGFTIGSPLYTISVGGTGGSISNTWSGVAFNVNCTTAMTGWITLEGY